MTRIGYFMLDPPFSTVNWQWLFQQSDFYIGLRTTLILAFAGGILSPLLFAILAYIIVRPKWRLR